MEVTYTLNPSDVSAFQKFVVSRGTRLKVVRWIVYPLAALAVAAGISWGYFFPASNSSGHAVQSSPTDWIAQVASVVIPLVIIFLFWFLVLRSVRPKQGDASLFSHPQTLSLSPERLVWQFNGMQTTVIWNSVPDISGDANSLYFFTGKDQGFIVPRRAFPNPEASEMFLKRSMALWKGEPLPNTDNPDTWPPPPHIGA